MIKRINCFNGCAKCINGILIKQNSFGEHLYICSYYEKKHKEVKGEECGNFRCSEYGVSTLCKSCSAGYPIKIRTI